MANEKYISKFKSWQEDWNKFVREVLKARLDKEQQAIITSVQNNPMTAVSSGTARGKDFVAACAALCFLYLTPKFDKKGSLIENTKIALTAPTGRQVSNIMTPEVINPAWLYFSENYPIPLIFFQAEDGIRDKAT